MHTRNFFSVLNIIRSLVDCNTTLQWLALRLSALWRKKIFYYYWPGSVSHDGKTNILQNNNNNNKKHNMTWSKS